MRRREFLIGATMATSPFVARAQPTPQMRRIGVLMNRAADDREGQAGLAAFKQALQQIGWRDGANLRFDIGWGEDDLDTERRYATELVGLGPDIVLASGTMSVGPLQKLSRVLPIVFVGVTDPAGAGFVDVLQMISTGRKYGSTARRASTEPTSAVLSDQSETSQSTISPGLQRDYTLSAGNY